MHSNSSQTGLLNNDQVTFKSLLEYVSHISLILQKSILKFHLNKCVHPQRRKKHPKHWGIFSNFHKETSMRRLPWGDSDELNSSSSIYLYVKISLNFYLQVQCKHTDFTFTSSTAYSRKGRGKKENQVSQKWAVL